MSHYKFICYILSNFLNVSWPKYFCMQQCKHANELKQRLKEEWAQLSRKTINEAIIQWRCRCSDLR